MRPREEISDGWAKILKVLHDEARVLDTRTIAERLRQPTEQIGADLARMAQKKLVRKGKKDGRCIWWVAKPRGKQTGFWGKTFEQSVEVLTPKVVRSRKRQGADARQWWSVREGKRRYEKTVPGAKVFWAEADEELACFSGDPRELQSHLSWGWGSSAVWKCGCKVKVPWGKSKGILTECRLPVCERSLAFARSKRDVPISDKPIERAACWMMLRAPSGLPVGSLYNLTCGCWLCVSPVLDSSIFPLGLWGVIARDRGRVVCACHRDEQRASGRQV